MAIIDWARLAQPQADGYDSGILNTLAHARDGWVKRSPPTAVTLCDKTVAVYGGVPAHANAALAGRGLNLARGQASAATANEITLVWAESCRPYLETWAAGYTALQAHLDELWCFWRHDGDRGSASTHVDLTKTSYPYHAIAVTGQDPNGLAQGIYHEYAHLRLRALGIDIETHDGRLLLNAPDELYTSSVRNDKLRPMAAVLHGEYAWLMLTENDYQNYTHGLLSYTDFLAYTAHHVQQIETGTAEIRQHGRFTEDGQRFIDGVFAWADDLIARCTAVYSENGA